MIMTAGHPIYNTLTDLTSYGVGCLMKSNGHFKCVDIPEGFVVKSKGKPEDKCATNRKAPLSGTSHEYTDANPSQGMISRDSRLDEERLYQLQADHPDPQEVEDGQRH